MFCYKRDDGIHSTEDAKQHGENLCNMAAGARFYAIGVEGSSLDELHEAITEARKLGPLGKDA